MQIKRTEIIAHRGCPFMAHENTMDSFSKAVNLGADKIEFDVRRTRDNILIAHHDPYIKSSECTVNISDASLNDLQVIARRSGFEIPRVDQILTTFCGKVGFDIELKVPECEQEVISMIRSLSKESNIVFTSFYPEILLTLKRIDSSFKTGFLFENESAWSYFKSGGIDFLCPSYKMYNLIKSKHHQEFRNFRYAVWTIDSAETMRQLFEDQQVDAVITNCTDIALAVREKCIVT